MSVEGEPGLPVTVSFILESQGDESSTGFTVNFNPLVFSNPVAMLGSGVPAESNLGTNINEVGEGRLGILVDSVNTYAAGNRQIITITFDIASDAPSSTYPITFSGSPTPLSVSSGGGGGTLLPATYVTGFVVIGPTAAGVEVTGRVLTSDGRGLRNAQVSIVDSKGVRRIATTGSFGYYRFDDIEAGEAYVIVVASKRYRFTPRLLQVFDNITEVDFVGLE